MCYSLNWKENNEFKSKSCANWSQIIGMYEDLYDKENISNLYIKDNEYGVKFINWQWERDENLIGWCGNR